MIYLAQRALLLFSIISVTIHAEQVLPRTVELVQAASSEECKTFAYENSQSVEYCTLAPRNGALPQNIIYYFHGLNGAADEIFRPEFKYIYYAISLFVGNRIPYLVSISFGNKNLLDFRDSKLASLEQKIIPHIESELDFGAARPTRHLMGGSLGGLSALNVAASSPQSYKSITALCPALLPFNIYSDAEVRSYVERNQPILSMTDFNGLVMDARQNYPSFDVWQKSNPLEFARNGIYDSMNVFISTGTRDGYGFLEGSSVLNNILLRRPSHSLREFHPVDGPHCSFDTVALLKFLRGQMQASDSIIGG